MNQIETRWIILIICMLLPAGLAVATLWIQWRNWRTRSWQQTTGRIDSSRVSSREVRSRRVRMSGSSPNTEFITGEDIRTGNFAHVAYSFAVASTTYRSNRICLMGEPDGTVPAILKRYPKGKIVTVLYNPENPNECILERDEPGKIREAWLGTAILAAYILGGFVAITEGVDWLGTVLVDPSRAPAVVFLTVFALFVVMLSRVFTKQTRAMKRWPTTEGRIVRSEIATTVQHHRRANRARGNYDVTMYVPRIVYAYQVGSHTFESDNVGWSTSSNKRSTAEKQVARNPLHARVRVFYDPDDPAQATLSPSMGMIPLVLWFFAAAMAVAAIAVGWLIP
ncbi:MAG: DUF3592 domain-containing protein [Reyranella sp.]|uniref:DUF3592 domain-containing protein n=1 Tax=Reyranella sp. TaxID=1929291 RepID=UPI003D13513A